MPDLWATTAAPMGATVALAAWSLWEAAEEQEEMWPAEPGALGAEAAELRGEQGNSRAQPLEALARPGAPLQNHRQDAQQDQEVELEKPDSLEAMTAAARVAMGLSLISPLCPPFTAGVVAAGLHKTNPLV